MIRLATFLSLIALVATAQVTQPKQTPPANARSVFAQLSQAADKARDAGRGDEAIQLYKRALDIQPKWKDGLWSLSSLLYERNQYAESRDWLRKLLGMAPELGLGWAMLGMSEFELHDYARALDHLERAMTQGMGDQKEIAQSVFYHVAILRIRFELFDDSMGLLIAMVRAGEGSEPLVEP